MDSLVYLTVLRAKIAETREAFDRAASASFLQDDPAKDQLMAMGLALEAMLQISEINDANHRNLATSLEAQIGEIAGKATDKLVERAGPSVANAIERSTSFHLKTIRLRAVLSGVAAVVVAVTLVAGFSFSEGFASGRTQGEVAANTISTAMAAGPNAASTWSLLMANNDPVQALTACKKSEATDSYGRHYCSMPVWLDRTIRPEEQ